MDFAICAANMLSLSASTAIPAVVILHRFSVLTIRRVARKSWRFPLPASNRGLPVVESASLLWWEAAIRASR
jgi:hypothetical protein